MDISEINEGSVLIVAVSGRVDSGTAKQLEEVLPERMQNTPQLVLDLADVQYVSSAGLRVMLKAAKIARGNGNKLVLAGLAPPVREVFHVSGFEAIFRIADDRAAALAALA